MAVIALAGLVGMAALHPEAPLLVVVGGSAAAVAGLSLALLPLMFDAACGWCPAAATGFALSASALCLLAAAVGVVWLVGHIG